MPRHTRYRVVRYTEPGPPSEEPPVQDAIQQGKSRIWLIPPGDYDLPDTVTELNDRGGRSLVFSLRKDLPRDHPLWNTRALRSVVSGSPQLMYNDINDILEIWSPDGNIPLTDTDFEPVPLPELEV